MATPELFPGERGTLRTEMSETDQQLVTIASTPIHSIADVVAVFGAIENAVPESDGLHWFNWLYLTVTKSVGASMGTLQWKNPSCCWKMCVPSSAHCVDATTQEIRVWHSS